MTATGGTPGEHPLTEKEPQMIYLITKLVKTLKRRRAARS